MRMTITPVDRPPRRASDEAVSAVDNPTIWALIAQEFGWTLLMRHTPYECGSRQGWARPASLTPGELRFEDAGCICHTQLERALSHWRTDIVHALLARVGEISRTVGVQVGMTEVLTGEVPEGFQPIVREVEAIRQRLEMLTVRMQLQRDLRRRFEEVSDMPAPLAGPPAWTKQVYEPR